MDKENSIAKKVVDASYQIHSTIGPGLLESVYETILCHEIEKRRLFVERQKAIKTNSDGLVFDEGFRAGINVEKLVIIKNTRRIRFLLSSPYPYQQLFKHVVEQLDSS